MYTGVTKLVEALISCLLYSLAGKHSYISWIFLKEFNGMYFSSNISFLRDSATAR